ncbi:hypothetical protein Q426_00035 [Streptococcus equi subsp. zooepidemicus CY]|nr:hypothetical protein Q426_00035 [Streptococcus equi subsp. zooepidemicus CY]
MHTIFSKKLVIFLIFISFTKVYKTNQNNVA